MPRRVSSGKAIDGILDAIGRTFPLPPNYDANNAEYEWMQQRFGLVDTIGDYLTLAGIGIGYFLPQWLAPQRDYIGWDIAVMFSIAILFPYLWLLLANLVRGGKQELMLFLRYYSSKYGIYWKGLVKFILSPFLMLGLIGAFNAYYAV